MRETVVVRRPPTRAGATTLLALALGITACGGSSSKPSTTAKPRNSAVARCAGDQCRVRIVCKGKVSVRLGPAPVRIHTTDSALTSTIIVDFAGPHDAVVRC